MKNNNVVTTVLWVVSSILALATVAFGVGFFMQKAETANLRQDLEYVYERSFYELVDNVNNIEIDLSKLAVTGTVSAKQKILDKIISETELAQSNIASLPVESAEIRNSLGFINHTNGYCTSLLRKIAKGENLSNDDLENIDSLYDSAKEIKGEMNRFATLLAANYKIIDNIQKTNDEMTEFTKNFSGMEEPSVDYPELIYDGPFSESVMNKEVRGLDKKEVTQDEAQRFLSEKLEDVSGLNYTGDTDGRFSTYNFTVTYNNGSKAYAQVTKQGGFLLTYAKAYDPKRIVKTQDECVAKALDFANKLGLSDMQAVWTAESQQELYINLVYTKNNVVVYPDLVMAKVAMDTGEVLGWEAMSYAYNHVERNPESPKLSLSDAEKRIPDELEKVKSRVAIIPGEFAGEILAYEFECRRNGNTFYVFINAHTGEQENIMRVVETDDGTLLM